jgi:GxxExxY protein
MNMGYTNLEGGKAGNPLKYSDLTQRIIACAIAVHRELGPGFIESIYERALAVEMTHEGLRFERQKGIAVSYRSDEIGEHRLDFLVEGSVVAELKAGSALEDIHFAIVRSYLKACKLDTGLLLNFAAMPMTIRRVGRERGYYSGSSRVREVSEPDIADAP